jgi:hypothetical protein
MVKGDPAYNYRSLEAMFKHAFNMCHVKDEVVSQAGQTYKIDMAKVFNIAKANRYRGYFSMEWEVKLGDVLQMQARQSQRSSLPSSFAITTPNSACRSETTLAKETNRHEP